MQEMTSSICSTAEVGTTGQLVDLRDNKTYWITKLADNNCWMTQNLGLDLSTSKPLTSADSDISSWTPTADTQQGTITKFPSSSNLTFSYSPGDYVYTTPTTQNSCGTSGITTLGGCPNWAPMAGLSRDTSGDELAHYLIGNYYSYAVATAGTAPSAAGTATSSICPKGWQLPTSNSTTASKSFGYLLTQYGVQSGVTNTSNSYDIRTAPLYFVYGGWVYGSSLQDAGSFGFYWSSTASSSNDAYLLAFSTGVNPSASITRYRGLSVRCVAR